MRKTFLTLILICAIDFGFAFSVYHFLPSTQSLGQGKSIQRKSSEGHAFPHVIDPQSRNYVKLQDVPKSLQRSIIVLEDARFYEHRGFDFVQIHHALESSFLRDRRLRGASTLSQQLVKNLYLSSERTWSRKFHEALITIKLELHLSKPQILELYLNSIDWGQGLIGIRAASRHYFGKRPQDLSIREAVFLAAIIPNPARFGNRPDSEFVRRQMVKAMKLLYREGIISLDDFRSTLMESIEL